MKKTDVFDGYSRYYDLLYRDKDYAAEAGYIDDVLSRNGIGGRELLEFGSGTGKHGCFLAARGYRVTGVERSAEMVSRATVSEGFTCQVGDIRIVRLGCVFDAVLSLFHVISYQVMNADVQAVFARAAEHLRKDGLFVFDIWYSPAVYTQQPEVRVKRFVEDALEITRIAEPVLLPNENRVDVRYTTFAYDATTRVCEIVEESHPMRHFSLPEIDLLAESSGFERVGSEELITGTQPGAETWSVCIVLRKTGP